MYNFVELLYLFCDDRLKNMSFCRTIRIVITIEVGFCVDLCLFLLFQYAIKLVIGYLSDCFFYYIITYYIEVVYCTWFW